MCISFENTHSHMKTEAMYMVTSTEIMKESPTELQYLYKNSDILAAPLFTGGPGQYQAWHGSCRLPQVLLVGTARMCFITPVFSSHLQPGVFEPIFMPRKMQLPQ